VQTYFSAVDQKKSLAEPDDFFHYNGGKSWHCATSGEER
jgi:hypothetical protein